MPLVRISLREGKTEAYKKALADGVHRALVEAIDVPAQDRFQVVTEHSAGELFYDPSYLGIERSDGIVLVQITLSTGRKPAQKRETLSAHEPDPGGESRLAPAGSDDQSGGSCVGELVVRQRRIAVHGMRYTV